MNLKENWNTIMIMIVKSNILLMDCNHDFYGIVYFSQMLMDINVNVLNNRMDQFESILHCMLYYCINNDWISNEIQQICKYNWL